MKTSFIYILLGLGLLMISCNNKQPSIIGTWEKVNKKPTPKEQTIIPITKGNNEGSKPKPVRTELTFKTDNTVDIKQASNEYSAKFMLKSNTILIGTREYELIKLDSDSLVIKAKSSFGISDHTDRYFRVK